MKKFIPFVILLFAMSAFGQGEYAVGTRAKNGKLVSLTNIVGLSDCQISNFVGEVRNRKTRGNRVTFELWKRKGINGVWDKVKETIKARKKNAQIQEFEVPLARIAPQDRALLFRDLIRKSFTLRVAGYACGSGDTISAFSIDLVY